MRPGQPVADGILQPPQYPLQKDRKIYHCRQPGGNPGHKKLYQQGQTNGVSGLTLLSGDQVHRREPDIRAEAALYSPHTAIFDSHRYMQTLEKMAEEKGVIFAYGCRVTGIDYAQNRYTISFIDTDGMQEQLQTLSLINSAGLHADKIAAMAGIDCDAAGYKIHYSKGEYYSISGLKRGLTSHLIYPVPGDDFLGIHTVLDLQGQLKLGPNAYYVKNID